MYFPTEVIYLPYAEISSQCMLAINIGRFKLGMRQSLLSQGTRKSRIVHPSRSCPGTRRVGAGIPHYSLQARGAKPAETGPSITAVLVWLWASLHIGHQLGWNCQESHMQSALADIFFTNSKQQENNANYVFSSLIP